jgi:hypothetical protein
VERALQSFGDGRADGLNGVCDQARVDDPDYRVGLVDGRVAVFEKSLLEAVRRALGDQDR